MDYIEDVNLRTRLLEESGSFFARLLTKTYIQDEDYKRTYSAYLYLLDQAIFNRYFDLVRHLCVNAPLRDYAILQASSFDDPEMAIFIMELGEVNIEEAFDNVIGMKDAIIYILEKYDFTDKILEEYLNDVNEDVARVFADYLNLDRENLIYELMNHWFYDLAIELAEKDKIPLINIAIEAVAQDNVDVVSTLINEYDVHAIDLMLQIADSQEMLDILQEAME